MSLSTRLGSIVNAIKGATTPIGGTQGPPEAPPSGPSTGGGGGTPTPPSAPFDPDQVDFPRSAPASTTGLKIEDSRPALKFETALDRDGGGRVPITEEPPAGGGTVPVRGVDGAAAFDDLEAQGDPDPETPERRGFLVVEEDPDAPPPPPEPGTDPVDGGDDFGTTAVDDLRASDGFDSTPGGRTGFTVVQVEDEDGSNSPLTPRTVGEGSGIGQVAQEPGKLDLPNLAQAEPGGIEKPLDPFKVEFESVHVADADGDGLASVARKAGGTQQEYLTVKMDEVFVSQAADGRPDYDLKGESFLGGHASSSTLVDLDAESGLDVPEAGHDDLDLDDLDLDLDADDDILDEVDL